MQEQRTDEALGKNLRKLRLSKGIKLTTMAGDTFVSVSALAKYERGETSPNADKLVTFAVYFGVTPNQLLGYEPLNQ